MPSIDISGPKEKNLQPLQMAAGHSSLPEIPLPEIFSSNPNTRNLISPTLRADAARYDWDNPENPRVLDFNGWRIKFDEIAEQLSKLKLSYHNYDHTIHGVLPGLERLSLQVRIPERMGTDNEGLTSEEIQLGQFAAICHDFAHTGNTYRQLTEGLSFSEGRMFSNEEYAAICADEFFRDVLTVPQRIALQGMILATSFGQSNTSRSPVAGEVTLLKREYEPHTWMEKLVAFADIANFNMKSRAILETNFRVCEEMSNSRFPKTYEDLLDAQVEFLDRYLRARLEAIAPLFPHRETFLDHYRLNLDISIEEIRRLYSAPKGDPLASWLRDKLESSLAERGLV